MAGSSGEIKVWYRLRGDHEQADSVVVLGSCDISDLKQAIHNKRPNTLGQVDAAVLKIYQKEGDTEAPSVLAKRLFS
jgi:hypothetical protein